MGTCNYCGMRTGFLSSRHKRCQHQHESGKESILKLATAVAQGQEDLNEASSSFDRLAKTSFIRPPEMQSLLAQAWEVAVDHALEDRVLSEEEDRALEAYEEHFQLEQSDLDAHGAFTRVVQSKTLRDLVNGQVPSRVKVQGLLSFNFQKSESLIWLFQDVKYLESRVRRSYAGGYSGASFRVAKGVYFRTGSFRGNPVVSTEQVHADTGLLGVTSKHLYFAGSSMSFRVRFDRIVSFQPFSDGIGIQRDAARAKHQIFQTGEGWFTYNVIVNASRLAAV